MSESEVKEITLGSVLGWVFGSLFLIGGLAFLFTNFLAGIVYLLIGGLLLPPLQSLMVSKLKISISKGLRIVLIIVLLFIAGSSITKNTENETKSSSGNLVSQEDSGDDLENVPEEESGYPAGTYKIGIDMPAGEYVIFSDGGSGYYEITSDSTGSFDSIVANDNFSYNAIVTVTEGQYLALSRSYAEPVEDVDDIDTTQSGMFKVGTHIEAGEYKLQATGDDYGYYEVNSASNGAFDDIVANDNFTGTTYITVEDGQYLTLSRAKILW